MPYHRSFIFTWFFFFRFFFLCFLFLLSFLKVLKKIITQVWLRKDLSPSRKFFFCFKSYLHSAFIRANNLDEFITIWSRDYLTCAQIDYPVCFLINLSVWKNAIFDLGIACDPREPPFGCNHTFYWKSFKFLYLLFISLYILLNNLLTSFLSHYGLNQRCESILNRLSCFSWYLHMLTAFTTRKLNSFLFYRVICKITLISNKDYWIILEVIEIGMTVTLLSKVILVYQSVVPVLGSFKRF